MVKKLFRNGCKKMKRGHQRSGRELQDCRITPLSKKHTCGVAKVFSVNGDRKQCARMASLGLYPGNEIELLSPSQGDNCIIKVHGGTVSIDRETMENILVSE